MAILKTGKSRQEMLSPRLQVTRAVGRELRFPPSSPQETPLPGPHLCPPACPPAPPAGGLCSFLEPGPTFRTPPTLQGSLGPAPWAHRTDRQAMGAPSSPCSASGDPHTRANCTPISQLHFLCPTTRPPPGLLPGTPKAGLTGSPRPHCPCQVAPRRGLGAEQAPEELE